MIDEIDKELKEVVKKPDEWLQTENDQLGGRKPKDLIETGNENQIEQVLDLIRAIKYGMMT